MAEETQPRKTSSERLDLLEVLFHKITHNVNSLKKKDEAIEEAINASSEQFRNIQEVIAELSKGGSKEASSGGSGSGGGASLSKEDLNDAIINSKEFGLMVQKSIESNIQAELAKYSLKPLLPMGKKKKSIFGKIILIVMLIIFIVGGVFWYFNSYLPTHPTVVVPANTPFYDMKRNEVSMINDFEVGGVVDERGVFTFKLNSNRYQIMLSNTRVKE